MTTNNQMTFAVVLRDRQLDFYRTAKNEARGETPASSLSFADLSAVARVTTKGGVVGFQLTTNRDTRRFCGDNERSTDEWLVALQTAMRAATIAELAAHPTATADALVAGPVRRVRNGHVRDLHAALHGRKLLFFKRADDPMPCTSHVAMAGARVCEKVQGSSDE